MYWEIVLKNGERNAGSRARSLAWIVDPATRTIAVFEHFSEQPDRVLHEGDALDGGSVLAGFQLEVAQLFVRLPK